MPESGVSPRRKLALDKVGRMPDTVPVLPPTRHSIDEKRDAAAQGVTTNDEGDLPWLEGRLHA